MRRVKQFIIDRLLADPVINSYVARRVVVMQYDFLPESMPSISVSDVSGSHRSIPSQARDMLVQVSIWSNTSALQTDDIYERMTQLLNSPVNASAKLAITNAGDQIYWMREDGIVDVPDPTRNVWHKAVTYRVWATSQ